MPAAKQAITLQPVTHEPFQRTIRAEGHRDMPVLCQVVSNFARLLFGKFSLI